MGLRRCRSGHLQGSAERTGGAAEATTLARAEARGGSRNWDRRMDVLCLCWEDVRRVDKERREG